MGERAAELHLAHQRRWILMTSTKKSYASKWAAARKARKAPKTLRDVTKW